MLSIENFTKSYSDTLVLNIPQLSLDTGVYWIKGENGSGKSTFFKSLSGLIPCKGKIVFDDGISLHDDPISFRKFVNYGEAEPVYPGFLTAKDLIRFIGKTKHAPRDQQQNLIAKFRIDHFLDKPCETYSSGMLKKLSLALTFLGTPRLIILDEPLITLDESSRQILFDVILDLLNTIPITFLISSHQAIDLQDLPVKAAYLINDKKLVNA
jgi:ABC-2 type transport system ATP-binding protein